MNRHELQNAWVKQLDGQALSHEEQSALLQLLGRTRTETTDSDDNAFSNDFRAEIQQDLEIDALLSATYSVDSVRFLESFQDRLEAPGGARTIKPPVQPPPVVEKPPVSETAEVLSRDYLAVDQRSETPWIPIIALSLTAILLIVVIPLVVVTVRGTSTADGSGKNGKGKVLVEDVTKPNQPIEETTKPLIPLTPDSANPESAVVQKPDPKPDHHPTVSSPDVPLIHPANPPQEELVDNADPKINPEEINPKRPDPVPDLEQEPEVKPQFLAMLVADDDARWVDGYKPTKQIDSQTLTLKSGVVQFEMNSGAEIEITGPAQWTFDSENSLVADRGRFLANVPKKAIGFAITTPGSRIIDLGTVFETKVDQDRSTKVEVISGKVELKTKATNKKIAESWRLTKGESKWVSATGDKTLDWTLNVWFGEKGKESFLFIDDASFDLRRADNIRDSISLLNRRFANLIAQHDGKGYSAELAVNGKVTSLANVKQVSQAQIKLMLEVQSLWMKAMLNE